MKVSCGGRHNPRAQDNDSQVLIFYCGPPEDEANVLSYGENLLRRMRYQPNSSNPYIFYKSDQQTFAGTKATGQKKNHLYKLKVPASYPEEENNINNNNDGYHGQGDGQVSVPPSTRHFGDNGASGSGSTPSSSHIPTPFCAQDSNQSHKRKLERAEDEEEVEETRKRISRLSPSRSDSSLVRSIGAATITAGATASTSNPRSHDPRPSPAVRLKIRFENIHLEAGVDTLIATFRADQRLEEVARFLSTKMPMGPAEKWVLLKTFPTEELKDLSRTIEEAGLANAVVIARRMC